MALIPLPIPLGFYQSESLPLAAQRCINWIPTIPQNESLNNRALIQIPGIKQFTDTLLGSSRGGWVMAGVPFFVQGNSLVSLSSTGVVTNHGAITGSRRVFMADNGTKLVIVVPGGDSFTFDGTTLTQITDPDFQVSDTVVFYRGFFVFTTSDGKQLFVSNLNQPLIFDALDFGSAEGDPDRIITQILDHDELSVLGERTTEIFRLVGGAGFPLAIIPGAFTEKGAHTKYGTVKFDNTYLYLGGGLNEKTSIWRQTSSSNAVKISTDAIDNAIQKFTEDEISEAFAMTYSSKGQLFAIFTLNSTRISSKTFVYNGTASVLSGVQVWFELQTGVTDDSWRANSIVNAYGKLLVGDDVDGRIGFIDNDTLDEYGAVIFRQMATSPFFINGQTIFEGMFEAFFESGTGLTTGQGSDPVARMDFSDNGARKFSSEFKRSIGKIGEFQHRAVWQRQGRIPMSRIIRLTVTDPIVSNLIAMAATTELGNNG